MIAHVLGEAGQTFMDARPRCGEDFCDGCGDCLDCYGDDWCPSGRHTWVVYDDQAEAWRDQHPDAVPSGVSRESNPASPERTTDG